MPKLDVDQLADKISDLLDDYQELRAIVMVIDPTQNAPCSIVTVGYTFPGDAPGLVDDMMQCADAIARQNGGRVLATRPFPAI